MDIHYRRPIVLHVHGSSIQRHTDIRTYRHTDIRAYGHTDIRTNGRTDYGHTDIQTYVGTVRTSGRDMNLVYRTAPVNDRITVSRKQWSQTNHFRTCPAAQLIPRPSQLQHRNLRLVYILHNPENWFQEIYTF